MSPPQDKSNEKDKDSKQVEQETLILPHELSLSFRAKKINAPYFTSYNEQQEENNNQD